MPPQTESRHGHGEDISHRKRPCSSPPMRVPLFVPTNVGKPSLRSTLKIRRKNGREMVPLYIWTIGNSNRHGNKDEIELIYSEECQYQNSNNGDDSDEINSSVKSTLRKNAPEFVPSNEWVFGNSNKDVDSDEITISLKSALRKSAPEFVPGMKWVVGNSNSDDDSEEISITLKSTLRKNAPDFVPGKEWAVGNSTKDDDSDKVCCLCEEPVKRTLFGMLSHCNHVFCVECLRGWRCAPGREHMLKRTCPKCRVISKTAIASPLWISDPCTKAKRMKSVRPLQ
ncbi:hypothetical protein CAPTEDRAFT_190587 [Capitella teleta]|uniref:RING-type domain-containing protein n=1 Tax=Capitella teleta TaxID=283909 RepID=R7UJ99_CAPTE|nr:hypothetical protein CAPTEDRAFT_190587 [Capitella teleta]|eukprot:ELU03352.1 hypothetical protein CAPTEDRAFT_190587 [Capitella teleta]